MDLEKEEREADLFDVLEDDTFSDEGITSPTLSSSSSALSSPNSSAPASPVPSTPPFPALINPATPILPDADTPFHDQPLGVAVMMPHTSESLQLVHIHLWSML